MSDSTERPSERVRVTRAPWLATVATAGGCALAALYLGLEARDADRVRKGEQARIEGRPARTLALAREVDGPPASIHAARLEAVALRDLGRGRSANRAFALAVERDPENWTIRLDWAMLLERLGDRRRAREQLDHARELNPRMPVPPALKRLLVAR